MKPFKYQKYDDNYISSKNKFFYISPAKKKFYTQQQIT